MERDFERVSRFMSYLLRHDPEDLKIDKHGFADIDELLQKVRKRFRINKEFISEIVDRSERKRFEIVGNKIRALYGHTMPVKLGLEEDKAVRVLYHGTTPEASSRILKEGLKSMKRRWVHLSPTVEIAKEVGLRRTENPVVLEIDAEAARDGGLKFFMATNNVYVCATVLPRYIRIVR